MMRRKLDVKIGFPKIQPGELFGRGLFVSRADCVILFTLAVFIVQLVLIVQGLQIGVVLIACVGVARSVTGILGILLVISRRCLLIRFIGRGELVGEILQRLTERVKVCLPCVRRIISSALRGSLLDTGSKS